MWGLMIKLAIFSIVKKVTVLLVAKKYGFHRLYRRMMEINKRFIPVDKQAKARELAQFMFRWPRLVKQWYENRKQQQAVTQSFTSAPASESQSSSAQQLSSSSSLNSSRSTPVQPTLSSSSSSASVTPSSTISSSPSKSASSSSLSPLSRRLTTASLQMAQRMRSTPLMAVAARMRARAQDALTLRDQMRDHYLAQRQQTTSRSFLVNQRSSSSTLSPASVMPKLSLSVCLRSRQQQISLRLEQKQQQMSIRFQQQQQQMSHRFQQQQQRMSLRLEQQRSKLTAWRSSVRLRVSDAVRATVTRSALLRTRFASTSSSSSSGAGAGAGAGARTFATVTLPSIHNTTAGAAATWFRGATRFGLRRLL